MESAQRLGRWKEEVYGYMNRRKDTERKKGRCIDRRTGKDLLGGGWVERRKDGSMGGEIQLGTDGQTH